MKKNGLAYIFFILAPLLFVFFSPALAHKNAKEKTAAASEQAAAPAAPAAAPVASAGGHEQAPQTSQQMMPQAPAQTSQYPYAYPPPANAYVAPNASLPGLCGYKCSSKNCPMDCNECCLRRQAEIGFNLTVCQENCARKAERQVLFAMQPQCLRSCQMCPTGCERCCDLKFSPVGGKSQNDSCKAACSAILVDACLESCFDPDCKKNCEQCCDDRYREDKEKLKCRQKCDKTKKLEGVAASASAAASAATAASAVKE